MLLSILALYNYDNTIFSTLPLPDNVDRETLVNQIILDNAELSLVYTSPTFMRWALENWGTTMLPLWDRFIKASEAEYNPIENYDRYEETERSNSGTTQHSGTDTQTNTGTDTTTHSGTDQTTHSGMDSASGTNTDTSTNGGTDKETNKIAAFDTTTLPVHDEKTIEHGATNTQSGSNAGTYTYGHVEALLHGETEALQHGHTQALQHGEKVEDSATETFTNHTHGNIGVTTSQQMLTQELEIIDKLNIYKRISDDFRAKFCVEIW